MSVLAVVEGVGGDGGEAIHHHALRPASSGQGQQQTGDSGQTIAIKSAGVNQVTADTCCVQSCSIRYDDQKE